MLEHLEDQIRKLKPFFAKGAVKDIFSWQESESLINLKPLLNHQRFHIISGKRYDPGFFAWTTDRELYSIESLENDVPKYLCFLQDASRVNSQVNTVCSELEELTKCPTDAHIYFDLNPVAKNGFGIHYDMSHNLIVQIEGKTQFECWDIKGGPEPMGPKPESLPEDPILDVTMEPGDAIFVPVYHYHRARSITKRLSISLPSCATSPFTPCQERQWIKLNID